MYTPFLDYGSLYAVLCITNRDLLVYDLLDLNANFLLTQSS